MAKIDNTSKWGRETAKARYGSVPDTQVSPAPSEQPPQFDNDKHGEKYSNDADGFVRGMGNESPHPKFDYGKSGDRHGR